MGFAHGQLMQEKAKNMMNDVWSYLEAQVVRVRVCVHLIMSVVLQCSMTNDPIQIEAINGTVDIFPKWFLDDVANVG